MDLGNHKVNLGKNVKGQLELEIYTNNDVETAVQYSNIVVEVVKYLGKEGYFDELLPSVFAIYDKHGQMKRIEDMV